MKPKILLCAALAAALPCVALAQAPAPERIDKRQKNQEYRIEQGQKSGNISAEEAKRLNKGQARIGAAEKKARADGTVTAEERARLERMQDNQNKAIRSQNRDKTDAGRASRTNPSASAGTSSTMTVDQRQAEQQRLFQQGQQTGRFNPEESALLHRNQVRIQAAQTNAKADGKVTAEETAQIEALQREQQRLLDNR
jgi:tellurite resistance protein